MTDRRAEALAERCRSEVLDLHRFFSAWFRGTVDASTLSRVDGALDATFQLVAPSGRRVPRDRLMDRLASARSTWGPDDAIRIDDLDVRCLTARLALVTYVERQRMRERSTVRRSSAILRAAAEAPQGVRWLHLHETWLEEVS